MSTGCSILGSSTYGLWSQNAWVQVLLLPLISCVTMDRLSTSVFLSVEQDNSGLLEGLR